MSRRTSITIFMWSILLCGSSVAKQEANNVFVNGRIYTVDDDNEWVEAVAIRDGKFVAVGSDEQVGNLRGPETKVVDLGGKLVLPGLVDDHLHLDVVSENGMNVTFDPRQNYSAGTIRDYLRKNPSSKWVYGGNVDWLQTSNGTISAFGKPSNKSILDGIVSDRPAFFWDIGGHAALVNRKLLRQCGITKDSEPPAGGAYDKDDSGELTGVLRETAAIAMWGAFNQDRPSLEEIAEGVKPVIEKLNSVGSLR